MLPRLWLKLAVISWVNWAPATSRHFSSAVESSSSASGVSTPFARLQ